MRSERVRGNVRLLTSPTWLALVVCLALGDALIWLMYTNDAGTALGGALVAAVALWLRPHVREGRPSANKHRPPA
jgi:hypothetical protein